MTFGVEDKGRGQRVEDKKRKKVEDTMSLGGQKAEKLN